MGGRTFKDFKTRRVELTGRYKEKDDAEKERVAGLKEELGDLVPKYPEPIPQDFNTFQNWTRYYKKNKPIPRAKNGRNQLLT